MPLAPLMLYIAVIDGPNPETWRPFSQPLKSIRARVEAIEVEAIGARYRGARINYLMRGVDTIDINDTPGIVGALIQGSDLSTEPSCTKLAERLDSLRSLALLLANQRSAYYRLYGFRLWLVVGQNQKVNGTQLGFRLKEPIAATLELKQTDIFFDTIEIEEALVHACKNAAQDAALRQPFIQVSP